MSLRPEPRPPSDLMTAPEIPFTERIRRPDSGEPSVKSSSRWPERWRLLNDVDVMQLPDPEWLVDGVIPRKGVAVIVGASGSGKTTLAAGLLVHIATGRSWFSHRIRHRGNSVYVAAEDPSGFKSRLAAAKGAASLTLSSSVGIYTFPDTIDLLDAGSVGAFTSFLQSKDLAPLECVVVDTFASVTPGAQENDSAVMTQAMSAARSWVRELGVSVIILHHTNAAGSRERGHSSMRGDADAMMLVDVVDDITNIECWKERNAAPFETIQLKLTPIDGAGCVFRFAGDVAPTGELSGPQLRALRVLSDGFPAEGATATNWQKACEVAQISNSTFWRVIKVLTEQGFVRKSGSEYQLLPQSRAALERHAG